MVAIRVLPRRRGRCMASAGRYHCGPRKRRAPLTTPKRAHNKPCACTTYQWPHKPGGGGCDWPGPPQYLLLTPAGEHRAFFSKIP